MPTPPGYLAPMPSPLPHRGGSRADLAMLFVVLVWGANIPIVKAALAEIPLLAFAGIRSTLAAVLFAAVVRHREGSILPPPGTVRAVIWLGLLGNTAYQILFMTGLYHTSVANTSLLLASNPVLVIVIGALTGVERLTPTHTLGVAVAFTGVVMVLANSGIHLSTASLAGDIPILLAALCWAVYTVGVRRWAPTMSPLRLTALTLLTGAPGLLLAGLPAILSTEWGAVTLVGWGGLAYSTIFALVLSYTLWNTSVAEVGPSRTAVYNCFIPVVAMLLAWATLGERPLPLQLGGAALIVGGVLITRLLPARRVTA